MTKAMKSLKRFKGEQARGGCKGKGGDNSAIKLEPASLAENEEALYTKGYVKRGEVEEGVIPEREDLPVVDRAQVAGLRDL